MSKVTNEPPPPTRAKKNMIIQLFVMDANNFL